MSTPQYRRIRRNLWFYRIGGTLLSVSIPLYRKGAGEGVSDIKLPSGIGWRTVDADNVPCEWLIPESAPETTAILYLHGGGGVLGLYNMHRMIAGHLSGACRLRFLLPDYRLAPENPFPSGLEDCLKVYRWMISNGFSPQKIAVAGDSAGGYLTISLLIALRATDLPLPAAAVCISPNTDPTCNGASVWTNRYRDALLSPACLRRLIGLYRGKHNLRDPRLSPLLADLRGLPPMLIQAGGDEILLDDSVRFADRAKAAGIEVTLEIWPHMWHVWQACVPDLPEANQAVEHIAKYLQAQIIC